MFCRTAPFSMTLNDPKPRFQGQAILWRWISPKWLMIRPYGLEETSSAFFADDHTLLFWLLKNTRVWKTSSWCALKRVYCAPGGLLRNHLCWNSWNSSKSRHAPTSFLAIRPTDFSLIQHISNLPQERIYLLWAPGPKDCTGCHALLLVPCRFISRADQFCNFVNIDNRVRMCSVWSTVARLAFSCRSDRRQMSQAYWRHFSFYC